MFVYKKVVGLRFGMLSPEFIRKMACCKIVTPELYDKEGYPVDGGLMDVRLGVIDPGLKCKTCGGKLKECVGHFGYMELARPLVHVKYVDMILMFLRCTCRECAELLVEQKKIDKFVEELDIIKKEEGVSAVRSKIKDFKNSIKSVKKCPHCKAKQLTVKMDKPTTFLEGDKRMSPVDVRIRLEKIGDVVVELLGLDSVYARPEWGILTILPVPPATIRPSITLQSGERSEDDLTHKLGDIVRINQRLFENINAGAPEVIVEDLWDLLQYHVTTYFDNNISQVPPARHRSGQALKTLSERVKSKEGRFRHNLAGKRVNYSARTVISPDSKIELNEVGVPLPVAMELTIPEKVTEWNFERMKKFVEVGVKNYPGANYVLRPDGKKKKITEETQEQLLEELQPGYVVERHLMDGDVVVFNRQPSLHRMSIMCHKVKVLPGKSFRLNPAVCKPYNADFDGDEMNMHVPQTEEARAEAEFLMDVKLHIIAPKDGSNIVGCSQDPVTGNYLLTRDLEFDKKDAIQILHSIGVFKPERFAKFKEKVLGREIFSVLLPEDFNYVGVSRDDNKVVVLNGELIEGVIDKNSIGDSKGGLIRALYAQYNEEVGIKILGDVFRLGIEVLFRRGFTTSVSDTDLSSELGSKCKEIIYNAERRVDQLIEQFRSRQLDALPGLSIEETVELKIREVLDKARTKVGEVISEIDDLDNSTIIMVVSGARGNLLNLAQMAACVGQQALGGRRIPDGYKGRVLSVFEEGDLGPIAKGFIRRGYKEGLLPEEFFMHSITGRDSLMDTALRTPKSGYLYRRLSSALQDVKVDSDSTVRDGNGSIIQFEYGDDGLDVSRTEGGEINVKRIVKEAFEESKNVT